jgi:hypothetical protein
MELNMPAEKNQTPNSNKLIKTNDNLSAYNECFHKLIADIDARYGNKSPEEKKDRTEYYNLCIKQNNIEIAANKEIIEIINRKQDDANGYIEIAADEESLEDKINTKVNSIASQLTDELREKNITLIGLKKKMLVLELEIKKVNTGVTEDEYYHRNVEYRKYKKSYVNRDKDLEITSLEGKKSEAIGLIFSETKEIESLNEKLNNKQAIQTEAIGALIADAEGKRKTKNNEMSGENKSLEEELNALKKLLASSEHPCPVVPNNATPNPPILTSRKETSALRRFFGLWGNKNAESENKKNNNKKKL